MAARSAAETLMKKKRHTPEEIIKRLREAKGLIAAGKGVEVAVRAIGFSVATYQRWKSRYGGIKKDSLKRLREPEKENARQSLDVSERRACRATIQPRSTQRYHLKRLDKDKALVEEILRLSAKE